MADKPRRASEYTSKQAEVVRATRLHGVTKLGDMMDDLVIIGGLVPSLIAEQSAVLLPTPERWTWMWARGSRCWMRGATASSQSGCATRASRWTITTTPVQHVKS